MSLDLPGNKFFICFFASTTSSALMTSSTSMTSSALMTSTAVPYSCTCAAATNQLVLACTCAGAAEHALLWPAVTETCSSTTSQMCHQAYKHFLPPLLAASPRCPPSSSELRSLFAAPCPLLRFAAPTASSPRLPFSSLPLARASPALHRRPSPASPRIAGPRKPRSLVFSCTTRAHALVPTS
jgi:hypothetical protein